MVSEETKDRSLRKQRTPLMLCHYLTPSSILIDSSSPTKEVVLSEMIALMAKAYPQLNEEKIKEAIWEREKEGRTVLENGLAIPHARIPALGEIKACLGIIPQGYPDPQEGILVKVVFLFLSPQESFESHLQMLAKISRVFQDPRLMDELLSVKSPEEAFGLLQRQERA